MVGKFITEVQPESCKACGNCRDLCPAGVFMRPGQLNTGGYAYMVAAHSDQCVGCLRCVIICPAFAITVRPQPDEAAGPAVPQYRNSPVALNLSRRGETPVGKE